MRAWAYKTKGKPSDVLRLEPNWPKPSPTSSQVLVKVAAAGLNPVDVKAMGVAPVKFMAKAPAVPGLDLSGWVEGGDLRGTGLAVGDEVFGIVSTQDIFKTGKGALAEYVAVEKDTLAAKPANVSLEEAATFPLTILTAYWALVTTARLQKGQQKRIFIVRPLFLERSDEPCGPSCSRTPLLLLRRMAALEVSARTPSSLRKPTAPLSSRRARPARSTSSRRSAPTTSSTTARALSPLSSRPSTATSPSTSSLTRLGRPTSGASAPSTSRCVQLALLNDRACSGLQLSTAQASPPRHDGP